MANYSETPWHPVKRFSFRFVFAYALFYTFPFPISELPGLSVLDKLYGQLMDAVVPWFGQHILDLGYAITVKPNGSGDTTYNYVQIFLFFSLSLLTAIIWSVIAKEKTHHGKLAYWLVVLVRYYLAYIMISYGFAKVIKTQFPAPDLVSLSKPFGDASPMGLVWRFMGHSTAYTVFTGVGEVLGGLLLLFRRTKLLGCLVTGGVMLHVVMLNFAYDVPVKLFSSHLFFMAVCLAIPQWRSLMRFAVAKSVEGETITAHFNKLWLHRASLVVKTVVIGFLLISNTMQGIEMQKKYGSSAPLPPLYGIYKVKEFILDGQPQPPLLTDKNRWQKFIVSKFRTVALKMDGSMVYFKLTVNEDEHVMNILDYRTREQQIWSYSQPQDGVLMVDGEMQGCAFQAKLVRDDKKFLLNTRGFHWVNEYPYNR